MPNYRRVNMPGGTFFFTLVTYNRQPILCRKQARRCLREAIDYCRKTHPIEINAFVLLPDHLHTIWTLPPGDTNFSIRWQIIKATFTRNFLQSGGTELSTTPSEDREGRRGIWQPRFWEHTIKDEDDFEHHFDYIHFNPVKHQLVQYPHQWEWSSFHRWVKKDVYPKNWGSAETIDFTKIKHSTGE